ncbi:hypothetical protein FAUST_5686 [Fusarium austroamericanum]|uniref:Ketoreductase (KR) domain-containing protein n=1 Tax=Fusarium austroamericanum TaxID=282268 RepID=A0AAN6C0P2_FUSAU|nr:hypothetical protein FAUST_5686 [Fusarium austroamericanum]
MPPSETGTIIITGANGSCALSFVSHLITDYPNLTLLATVRNASPSDPNTARLAEIISTSSRASIESLDLSSLSKVRTFADKTAQRVEKGEIPPIKAIVCNAFTMSLKEQVYTEDGFERTFQVNHLSHYLLVLKLNPKLSGITATAMDPGGMVDSRAHKIQKPIIRFAFSLIVLLLPITKHFTDELRSSAQSGRELVELAVGDKYQGEKGYFMGARREKEDAICMDAEKRDVLWKACWEWAGIKKKETALEQ